MAPKRSNKGKKKVEEDDDSVFKTHGMSSIGQRVAFSRKIQVIVNPTSAVDNFESFFKVSRKTFNYIRSLVRERMIYGYTNFTFSDGKSMSLNDQIAISLTRLSSIDSTTNVAILFETNDLTVDTITWEFVKALEAHSAPHISWPLDLTQMKSRFERISGMPNCCGAIATTHVKMYPHTSEGETKIWLDSMNNNSVKLQVIVDVTMRFLDVVSGFPGRMTKDSVLQQSEFFKSVQTRKKLNRNVVKIPVGTKIQEYIVGDSGFQLRPWLITPYRDETLTEEQTEFNKKHLATRLVAGCALKKLKDIWAGIEADTWRPDRHKLPRIILACCILHNIQIDMEGDEVSSQFMDSFDHDPGYPPDKSTLPEDKNAAVVRDKLSHYLAGKLRV